MAENENILLHRFVENNDAEAFSEIVQQHAGMVYGVCLRVLGDKNKAADVVQDTFLQLLRSAGDITGSLTGWLHKVATGKAVDVIRKDSRLRRREAEYAAKKLRETSDWSDISVYVDEGLAELDEQVREILIEHFLEGRTMKDIGSEQGISQPTVSRRIEAGILELRKKLHKRGVIVAIAVLSSLLSEKAVEAAPALVLKELGKMALVGSIPAAASGSAAAGATTKVAGGVLAGVKAKAITAAAVTAIAAGGVVTYNQVTKPDKQPAVQVVQPTQERREQEPTQTAKESSAEDFWTLWELEEMEEETDSSDESLASEMAEDEPATNTDQTEPAVKARGRGSYGAARGGYGYTDIAKEPNSKDNELPPPVP